MKRLTVAAVLMAVLSLGAFACENRREGPGDAVDEAGDDIGRSVEDATD